MMRFYQWLEWLVLCILPTMDLWCVCSIATWSYAPDHKLLSWHSSLEALVFCVLRSMCQQNKGRLHSDRCEWREWLTILRKKVWKFSVCTFLYVTYHKPPSFLRNNRALRAFEQTQADRIIYHICVFSVAVSRAGQHWETAADGLCIVWSASLL